MKRQTITVASDDDNEATTTIRLELDGSRLRITQVVFDLGPGQDITAAYAPAIDLAKLLEAVLPAAAASSVGLARTISTAPAVAGTALDTAAQAVTTPGPADDAILGAAVKPARADRRPQRKAAEAKAPVTAEAALPDTSAPRKSSVKKVAQAKKPRSAAKAAVKPVAAAAPSVPADAVSADTGGGRVRRTMPDDFVSVYGQAATVAAVADYYRVPAHTAQGWVKTARKRGLIPAARSRARS